MGETILSLNGIGKKYPGVTALNDINIDFQEAEIHAIAGENGAGKSTMIKIISGAIKPTSGTLSLYGNSYASMTPDFSKKNGIAVIYQEFTLVPSLSVAENVFLGQKKGSKVFINRAEMEREAENLFERLGVSVNPRTQVKNLSVAHQQMVEIAKALSREAKILIMDEPSAPLTKTEVDIMLALVKKLKESGVTIIYISHRLDELFEISDRITVLRDGQQIITLDTDQTNKTELIHYMVGRELKRTTASIRDISGDVAFEARHVTGNGVQDISLSVRKGEILGLAGLVGAGRTEFSELAFGKSKLESGVFLINGKEVKIDSPHTAIRLGVGLVPEDRKRCGVLLEETLRNNVLLPSLERISKLSVINNKKATNIVDEYVKMLRIKTPSYRQKVKNLSGGNQQKVVLAKWLAAQCEILIVDEPTRGIDIGAKQEIYNLISDLAEQGKCIIVISSEMEEILGISDRIIVLHEHKVAGEIKKEEFSQDRVLALASGETI